MTATSIETVRLSNGRTVQLTIGEPEHTVRGGIVVLHEARGVTDTVRALVGSLASEGWLAVAPHYGEADDDGKPAGVSSDAVLADTDAACLWLADHDVPADRVGVIGFDLGGTVAFLVAASRSIGAAVSVAGGGIAEPIADGMPALVDVASDLGCPWLGIYGDRDAAISADDVQKLRAATESAEVATDVVRFADIGHRFDIDHDAAFEAWHRTLNWFDAHLR